MTTYAELVTQIRNYTETDDQVITTVIVNDLIEHAEHRMGEKPARPQSMKIDNIQNRGWTKNLLGQTA